MYSITNLGLPIAKPGTTSAAVTALKASQLPISSLTPLATDLGILEHTKPSGSGVKGVTRVIARTEVEIQRRERTERKGGGKDRAVVVRGRRKRRKRRERRGIDEKMED